MKSTKSKAAKKAKRKTAAGGRKAKNLVALREQIAEIVKGHAVGMVDTTIAEVDKGHFAAMKYLFELIGLYPGAGGEEPEAVCESVLAKTLVRRLGLEGESSVIADPVKPGTSQADTEGNGV